MGGDEPVWNAPRQDEVEQIQTGPTTLRRRDRALDLHHARPNEAERSVTRIQESPPVTSIVNPVTKSASCDARNAIPLA